MGSLKKGVNEDNSYEDDNIEVVDENYNFQGVNQAALARHLLSPPSPSGQQVCSLNLCYLKKFPLSRRRWKAILLQTIKYVMALPNLTFYVLV